MMAMVIAFIMLVLSNPVRQQPAAAVKTYAVSGRVIDGTTGGAINQAVVVFWERSKSRPSGRRIPVANGTFSVSGVAPGQYTMAPEVPGAGYSYRTETVDVDVRDSDVTGIGLIITPLGPRPATVAGRLVMENGASLPPTLTRIAIGGESATVQRDGTFQLRLRAEEKYPIKLQTVAEGTYVRSVSAGFWNVGDETLLFSSTPPSNLQITLAVGNRLVRGRVRDKTGAPGAGVPITLFADSSSVALRNVSSGADGTFLIDRLRAGNYTLKAKLGAGEALQAATLSVTIGSQDRTGIDVALKGTTLQKGRVVIEGAARLEELLRFRPMIEITDTVGVRRVPINADGTFEFQSVEGEYTVATRDVPLGYDKSVIITGSTVEVKLRVVQGDSPFFRVLPPR